MHSLRTLPHMKRHQTCSNLPTTPSTPPSTPQTIHTTQQYKINNISSNSISSSSSSTLKKAKRSLTTTYISSSTTTPQQEWQWQPLNLPKSELFLPLTFPTGQTFTWKQTAPHQYTGVINSHLISLKHLDNDLVFCVHYSTDYSKAKACLGDYLNLDISLVDMWKEFAVSDSKFAELALHLEGARVLRQDPIECLMQFLCSSNNNIGRITKMVDFISSLGDYLGIVEGFRFHKFPTLDRLALVSENDFRAAGFGYRAKYIVGTVKALQLKPGGGAKWLMSLRSLQLHEVIDALCTLPGVGPKVAACIALFSLNQHHAVPVDTHVWQIATRDLVPELKNSRLTPKLCSQVAEAFVTKYGKYAGWAQTLLFIAELPSQKALLQSNSRTARKSKFG